MDDEVRQDWTRNEGTTLDAWMLNAGCRRGTPIVRPVFFLVTLFQFFQSFVFFFLSVLPLLFFIFFYVILVFFSLNFFIIHHVYLGGENVGDTCHIAHSDVQVHVIMHAHT